MPSNAENLLKRIEAFPNLARLRGVISELYNAVLYTSQPNRHNTRLPSTLPNHWEVRREEARAALLPLLEELLTYDLLEQRNTSED
jgi:hypothetical protein